MKNLEPNVTEQNFFPKDFFPKDFFPKEQIQFEMKAHIM